VEDGVGRDLPPMKQIPDHRPGLLRCMPRSAIQAGGLAAMRSARHGRLASASMHEPARMRARCRTGRDPRHQLAPSGPASGGGGHGGRSAALGTCCRPWRPAGLVRCEFPHEHGHDRCSRHLPPPASRDLAMAESTSVPHVCRGNRVRCPAIGIVCDAGAGIAEHRRRRGAAPPPPPRRQRSTGAQRSRIRSPWRRLACRAGMADQCMMMTPSRRRHAACMERRASRRSARSWLQVVRLSALAHRALMKHLAPRGGRSGDAI
jgi:hypothetical protein